jgi:aromatic amino acid aminotransferase I / 2-aminoadipate transaminase
MSPPPPAAIDIRVESVTDTTTIVLPDPIQKTANGQGHLPFTIKDVHAHRLRSGPMAPGVAPFTSSDMFKSPGSFEKPRARRWDHWINQESSSRTGSSLKKAARYLKTPGLISLGGGLPSSDYFPFEHIDVKVPEAPHFSEQETLETGVIRTAGKHDIREGKSLYDLEVCLNYGQATGSAQLLRFMTEHTEIVHKPPYRDWACCLTTGSTQALEMCFRMFCSRGDFLLTEEYTFATAVETATPLGIKIAGVKMDKEGMLADDLDHVLSNWVEAERGGPKPFLLYTVPTGQNPTGATQSCERRNALYAIAEKHDLCILEDEPYYFLQMEEYVSGRTHSAGDVKSVAHDHFLNALIPSYLSMDTSGRVLRLDSFSKIIAPGSRVGWITGAEQLVERFIRHSEVSTQNPSGISQIVLYKLLEETWGHGGFLEWLMYIRSEYTRRRDIIVGACEHHLPHEVASWNPPMAGMFHWINIQWHKHPKFDGDTSLAKLREIEDSIFQAAIDKGVLCSLGSWFRAQKGTDTEVFFRATFAAAPADKVEEAISRFGEALREVFELEKGTGIENGGNGHTQ